VAPRDMRQAGAAAVSFLVLGAAFNREALAESPPPPLAFRIAQPQ